jgi:hypothetical protein
VLLAAAPALAAPDDGPDDTDARARAAHSSAIVVDGHNDVLSLVVDFGFDLGMDGGRDGLRSPWPWLAIPALPRTAGETIATHTDLERMRRGASTRSSSRSGCRPRSPRARAPCPAPRARGPWR